MDIIIWLYTRNNHINNTCKDTVDKTPLKYIFILMVSHYFQFLCYSVLLKKRCRDVKLSHEL